MMRKIELWTAGGEHYVATVEVLPMEPLPRVVVWGTRLFTVEPSRGALPEAWEAMATVSFTPSPGLPRELPDTEPPPPPEEAPPAAPAEQEA